MECLYNLIFQIWRRKHFFTRDHFDFWVPNFFNFCLSIFPLFSYLHGLNCTNLIYQKGLFSSMSLGFKTEMVHVFHSSYLVQRITEPAFFTFGRSQTFGQYQKFFKSKGLAIDEHSALKLTLRQSWTFQIVYSKISLF